MSKDLKVQDGQVVSMEYTLTVDGEVVDSSEGRDPLEYLHGSGNIIPGLEREMTDMAVGDSKDVVVTPADGYGEINDAAYMEVPKANFPDEIPVEVGTELQIQDQNKQPRFARIDKVEGENVRLNMNHPLAGKELNFSVKVVSMREASEEERQHGHVHGSGHAH